MRFFLMVIFFVFLFVGCGGDGDDDNSSNGSGDVQYPQCDTLGFSCSESEWKEVMDVFLPFEKCLSDCLNAQDQQTCNCNCYDQSTLKAYYPNNKTVYTECVGCFMCKYQQSSSTPEQCKEMAQSHPELFQGDYCSQ